MFADELRRWSTDPQAVNLQAEELAALVHREITPLLRDWPSAKLLTRLDLPRACRTTI